MRDLFRVILGSAMMFFGVVVLFITLRTLNTIRKHAFQENDLYAQSELVGRTIAAIIFLVIASLSVWGAIILFKQMGKEREKAKQNEELIDKL